MSSVSSRFPALLDTGEVWDLEASGVCHASDAPQCQRQPTMSAVASQQSAVELQLLHNGDDQVHELTVGNVPPEPRHSQSVVYIFPFVATGIIVTT